MPGKVQVISPQKMAINSSLETPGRKESDMAIEKMHKKIYLIWDRKFCCVWKATTNRSRADEEVKRLNATEHLDRYRIKVMEDFANTY